MTKNHVKILGDSRLQDPSLTGRITLIAIVVWKLRKSQVGIVELSGIWTSLVAYFYNKVVDHLIRFPTMQTVTLSD